MKKVRHGLMDEYSTALIMLDLDGFKEINDQYGHHNGDFMLKHQGERLLKLSTNVNGVAGRLGGDEFLVVLPDQTSQISLENTGRRIIENLSKPVNIEGRPLAVSVSVGCSISIKSQEVDVLLKAADAALYQAKSRGRSKVVTSGEDLQMELEKYEKLNKR